MIVRFFCNFAKRKSLTMRKKGSVFLLKKERNEDLMRAYKDVIKKQLALYGRVSQSTLMSNVVNSPAERYWVSSERAYSIILRIEKGELPPKMKSNSRRFYESLYKDFCEYRNTHPDMPIKHIVEIVVQQPAPCFVLSPRIASWIIFKLKQKCRAEKLIQLTQ